jgi:hypothetical protein
VVRDEIKHRWFVELHIDYAARTYRIGNLIPFKDANEIVPATFITVEAADEIGVFVQTRRSMANLGFEMDCE